MGRRRRSVAGAAALAAGSQSTVPLSSATRPPLISVFTRSRDRLGSASASARSSRSPTAPASSATVKIYSPSCTDGAVGVGRRHSRYRPAPHVFDRYEQGGGSHLISGSSLRKEQAGRREN